MTPPANHTTNRWEPYPNPGMLYRLDVGWGPPSLIPELPTMKNAENEKELIYIDNLISQPKHQEHLYGEFSENTDIDVVAFKEWLE